jgi:hypothetical protein
MSARQFHPDLIAWAREELAQRAIEDQQISEAERGDRRGVSAERVKAIIAKSRGIRRKRAPSRLSRATCRELLAFAAEAAE